MKYLAAVAITALIIILVQTSTRIALKELEQRVDLKILTHELKTPPVSYEEIVAVITDTVVPGAIKEN